MVDEKLLTAIRLARERSPKRNFKQSFDMAINFKNIDIKKPEGKIKAEIKLPNPPPKIKVGFFADTMISQGKNIEDKIIVISKEQLDKFSRNKKAVKALIKQVNGFIAETHLMPLIAKSIGPVLAVRGKMPKPVPTNVADIESVINNAAASVRIAVKDSPAVHLRVGTEDMKDEEIASNIDAVLKAITAALPKGKEQIKDAIIKLTMGKPVKLEVVL